MNLSRPATHFRQRQGGVAVIVMLALLSILLIYISANIRTLRNLETELKLIEQRQVHRLSRSGPASRPPAPVNPAPALNSTPRTP